MGVAMTGVDLWQMLAEVEDHPDLTDDDRMILQAAFEARRRDDVVRLPEVIIGHLVRLHADLTNAESK